MIGNEALFGFVCLRSADCQKGGAREMLPLRRPTDDWSCFPLFFSLSPSFLPSLLRIYSASSSSCSAAPAVSSRWEGEGERICVRVVAEGKESSREKQRAIHNSSVAVLQLQYSRLWQKEGFVLSPPPPLASFLLSPWLSVMVRWVSLSLPSSFSSRQRCRYFCLQLWVGVPSAF